MAYQIDYTESSIDQQLLYQPLVEVRNRKPLESNELGRWELRVGKYRIFYDVEGEDMLVVIKAVGWKEHNTLYIRGKEYEL